MNAVYLFPPSLGPSTLNSRIAEYLKRTKHPDTPCRWQRSLLTKMLKDQYDTHPNCVQIVGGDFNHKNWHIRNHPTTHTFLSDLQLQNTAFDAVNLTQANIPTPVTFPNHESWIDHILIIGRAEVKDFCDYRDDLITTLSDHVPYSNDIYIHLPTTHYNIPTNLHANARSKLKAVHIKKHDSLSTERYQALCNKHLNRFTPTTDSWSPLEHEQHYEFLCNSLVQLAKRATKFSIRTSMPTLSNWSPDLSFLYKLIKLLKHLLSDPKDTLHHNSNIPAPCIRRNIATFLHHHYMQFKIIDNIPTPRYRLIINKLFPNYPSISPFSDNSLSNQGDHIRHLLQRCRQLCHAKHQQELRANINTRIKAHEKARSEGKLKKVITWILEKDTQPRFSTTVTADHKVKALPHEAHKATLTHFTNHFSCHPWIIAHKFNDPSEEGENLRQSLLHGTWRNDYPTLIESLDPRHQKYATAYLDNFAYKANTSQRQALHDITALPVTFETFYHSLLHRCGTKSPGPSGLTISILQATPAPILASLHSSLATMWEARHIPSNWQARELALLPKKPTSITLAEMRPLMLLEVLRKLWLNLILKPVSGYLNSESLICPYQVGGIPNSGTEDAILQIVNALEDSTERAENIEILAFDKAKAFDSPGRLSGIALAWQRLGLPPDIANYIANCDNFNQIFPRTPYYLSAKSRNPTLAFHAVMGTPQGCSSASLSYLVVEDIILSTFHDLLEDIDPYLARDPTGTLFPQPPTQFVDDTYVFCRTPEGAQNAINILQTAEPLLNIRINPAKTRHFSLHWSPPTSNNTPTFSLDAPTTLLYAHSSTGEQVPIPPIPLSTPTRVLGAFIAPDLSTDHLASIKSQIKRMKTTLNKKKASLATLWSVMKTSIFPKFTYLLKFTNLSMHDLNNIAAPFRDLIRKKAHASHIPNTILFGSGCAPYSLPYHDLMHHTLKEKESTMLRMLGGSPRSRQIIHSLLSRGYRLISDHITFNNSPLPCPSLPNYLLPSHPSHYCWALCLIQYLQAADSNLHVTPPFPITSAPTPISQTPLHNLYDPTRDHPLLLTDIHDFESSYHIHFVEELFSYPPLDASATIDNLRQLFPPAFLPFLRNIIENALHTPHLTLGTIITREHIIVKLPSLSIPAYIEGLITPSLTQLPTQALIRHWSPFNTNRNPPTKFMRITHTAHLSPIISNIPIHTYVTTRYLHSAIGYTHTYATCKTASVRQRILPRITTSLHTTYAQPKLLCAFPQAIIDQCARLTTTNLYTDGSLKPTPLSSTMLPPYNTQSIFTSIIFANAPAQSTSWAQRDVTGIRISFPITTTATNYTAEILGVAAAVSLPLSSPHIYTDAKGIVTSVDKTLHQTLSTSPHLNVALPRNYTETGLLYKHIITKHHTFNLHHIKAHQEDSTTAKRSEHGTGNRIADLVAQGDITSARTLCRSLQLHTYTIDEFIQSPSLTPLISLGSTPSPHDFHFHHPNITAKAFHINCINQWLTHIRTQPSTLSTLQWTDLTWNLAGSAITKYSQNIDTKTFLIKVLYDALPNAYTKYKYSSSITRPPTPPPQTPADLPLCSLCTMMTDSLSHLLCSCTHPSIDDLRKKLHHQLHALIQHSNPNHSNYFPLKQIISNITSNFNSLTPDHRSLLGLFHAPSLPEPIPNHLVLTSIFTNILPLTASFISAAWKIYNDITHSVTHNNSSKTTHTSIPPSYTPTPKPTRLLVISGNNGTLTLQDVHDHPPKAYQTRRKKQSRKPILPHHLPSKSLITAHFSSNNSTQPPSPMSTICPINHSHSPTSFPNMNAPVHTHHQPPPAIPLSMPPEFTFPRKPHRLPTGPPRPPIQSSTQEHPSPIHNCFQALETLEPLSPPLPQLPHHRITPLMSPSTKSLPEVFHQLSFIPHDVPQNGDCFYLTVQLFIAHHYNPPILTSVSVLRTLVSNLLTTTPSGEAILRDYNLTTDILIDTLPQLRPATYPNRDIFAQDYVIAAMATLVNTPINVYTTDIDSSPILHTFEPYPNHPSPYFLPHPPPVISIWAPSNHFQLLLLDNLSLPSLTTNLLPLPLAPLHDSDPNGNPTVIPANTPHEHQPRCPHANTPPTNSPYAFCLKTCHPYCPNHYSAFKPIPHQRLPKGTASSTLLALAGVPANTPIFEVLATIHPTPSHRTVPITAHHHSDALHTHPLLKLMYSTHEPNCHLAPILIPEPTPHLKLFVVTSFSILPYTPLRIRPPPEPPPSPRLARARASVVMNSLQSQRSLITSYFTRHNS